MTTITRFTKEQLRERAREKVKSLEFAVTQNAFADSRAELEEELELARIALASLTAEPVLYAAEETLAYAKMGELHLTCLSEPMGDAVIPLYTAPPVPVVPEEMPKGLADQIVSLLAHNIGDKFLAQKIWNACRAAMLQGGFRDLSQPVDPQVAEYEQIMLQDGWVMVPVEPTEEMIAAAMECEDVLFNSDGSFCVQFREIYCAMVDAALALNKGEY
ncbi:hypothetical protein F8G92_02960 [Salmonella enterica subsp. enterica serovar Reading]|nr:hypothetical protein [Salmonella enterica subsp. enterica serovar Eko]EDP0601803.1 hypothetical protein [Salmonella enterica subsp. enterica serovar Reading]EEN9846299.1 hypothetical protein [Salmonella enterica]EDP1181385.1 hypothetical protein [Salmonella enterica subsp. enterica serovar Reading]EDP1183958.1 hypothetical protein [Salmonella enterica subsp. enterica serovar Reading]